MQINPKRTKSALFDYFGYRTADRIGRVLIWLTVISLIFGLAVETFWRLAYDSFFHNHPEFEWIIAFGAISFFSGIFLFVAAGTYIYGKTNKKSSFLAALTEVLWKTFLYVLLPCAAIAAALIIWAILTNQPAFS